VQLDLALAPSHRFTVSSHPQRWGKKSMMRPVSHGPRLNPQEYRYFIRTYQLTDCIPRYSATIPDVLPFKTRSHIPTGFHIEPIPLPRRASCRSIYLLVFRISNSIRRPRHRPTLKGSGDPPRRAHFRFYAGAQATMRGPGGCLQWVRRAIQMILAVQQ
jgi:hypothetical protein